MHSGHAQPVIGQRGGGQQVQDVPGALTPMVLPSRPASVEMREPGIT
jgi:hypothetical protein